MTPTKTLDVRSEEYREYHYGSGNIHRINNPQTVHILYNDVSKTYSQRVVDGEGVTHRPSLGYLAISWKPREGAPAFVA